MAGKWDLVSTGQGKTSFEFTDKKFVFNSVQGNAGKELSVNLNGTYTLEADKIVLKAETASIDDSKLPEKDKTMLKAFLTPAKITESFNKNGSFGIKFTDADNAALTPSAGPEMKLKRIKS